ncbi:MAG: hypothetical protein AB7G75_29440 [Candidatus Binatia bacterium]
MIVSIESTETGFTLTLRKPGGELATLSIPKDALYDRPRLQRLAMQLGVRLRLKKFDAESWRQYLAERFGSI